MDEPTEVTPTYRKVWLSHCYNPSTTVTVNDRDYVIGAGTGDHTSVWRIGDDTYVLTERRNMPYFGLERLDPDGQPADVDQYLSDRFTDDDRPVTEATSVIFLSGDDAYRALDHDDEHGDLLGYMMQWEG